MEPVLRLVLPTFERYAALHGYDIRIGTGNEAKDRPASWSKVPFIESLLESYDSVFWVDSDAVFHDDGADVWSEVDPGSFQAMAIPDGRPNLGVWAIRSSSESEAFLRLLFDQTRRIHHENWETAAACDLMGWTADGPPKKLFESPWDTRTHWLGREWNVYYSEFGTLPVERIHHYPGLANRTRVIYLRRDLGQVGFVGRLLGEAEIRVRWRLLKQSSHQAERWNRD